MKRIFIISFAIFFSCFFTGCEAQRQLRDRLIVQGIGIDFENEIYNVVLNIFDADSTSTQEETKPKLVESSGKSLFDALSNIVLQTGETFLYSQNSVVLLGQSVAENGVNNIMDFFVKHREFRPDVTMFTVKGRASEIMKTKIDEKSVQASDFKDMGNTEFLDSEVIGSNILKFVSSLKNETSDPTTLFIELEKKGEISIPKCKGLALYRKDKLVSFLEKDETLAVMLLVFKVKEAVQCLQVPQVGDVTVNITNSSSVIDVKLDGLKLICDAKINVNADIYEIGSTEISKNNNVGEFFKRTELELANTLRDLILVSFQETFNLKSDVVCLGKRLLQRDIAGFNKIVGDFENVLSNAQANVNVSATVRRSGKEI